MESRNEAALRVSHLLARSEGAIDGAYKALAELAANLPELQRSAGLSAVYGHELFGMVNRSQASIVVARDDIVAAHNRLYALKRKLGIEVVATGPVDKPDPWTEPGGPKVPTTGVYLAAAV